MGSQGLRLKCFIPLGSPCAPRIASRTSLQLPCPDGSSIWPHQGPDCNASHAWIEQQHTMCLRKAGNQKQVLWVPSTFLSSFLCQSSESCCQGRVLLQLPCLRGTSVRLQKSLDTVTPLLFQPLSTLGPKVGCDWADWETMFSQFYGRLQYLRSSKKTEFFLRLFSLDDTVHK